MCPKTKIIFGGDYFPSWQPKISLLYKLKCFFKKSKLGYSELNYLNNPDNSLIKKLFAPYLNLNAKATAHFPLRYLSDLFEDSDINCLNLETSLSMIGDPIAGKQYNLRSKQIHIEGLLASNINLVVLANNHILDYGIKSLFQTMSLLKQYGIRHSGICHTENDSAQTSEIIISNDIKIGFLSYVDESTIDPYPDVYFSETPHPFKMREGNIIDDIQAAKKQTNHIIVNLHWGEEWNHLELESQGTLARRIIDAGATAVIGHHPHVVQKVEEYKKGLIAYSLGNLYMYLGGITGLRTRNSFLLKLILSKQGIDSYDLFPIQQNSLGQPVPDNQIDIASLIRKKRQEMLPGKTNEENHLVELRNCDITFFDSGQSFTSQWSSKHKFNRILYDQVWKHENSFVSRGKEFCAGKLFGSFICFSGYKTGMEIIVNDFENEGLTDILFGLPDWFAEITDNFFLNIMLMVNNEQVSKQRISKNNRIIKINLDKTDSPISNIKIKLEGNENEFTCLLDFITKETTL